MAESNLPAKPKWETAIYDPKVKNAFLQVVDEKTYLKEIVFAYQAFRNSKDLQGCDSESIRTAVANISLTGATLNPALQQAYLIPRKGKCCLDFSYRGLCKIAVDSDSVYDIDAAAVFEGDEFYYELGLNPRLEHVPNFSTDTKKKEVIAAYAIATLHHGIKKFVVLDKEKIERARKSSQTGTVWNAHYDEMAKKTAVKLLYQLLPQTERMSVAVDVLNEHEGLPPKGAKAESIMNRFSSDPIDIPTDDDSGACTGDSTTQQGEQEGERITKAQASAIKGTLKSGQVNEDEFCKKYGIKTVEDLTSDKHKAALEWILEEAKTRKDQK